MQFMNSVRFSRSLKFTAPRRCRVRARARADRIPPAGRAWREEPQQIEGRLILERNGRAPHPHIAVFPTRVALAAREHPLFPLALGCCLGREEMEMA